MNEANLKRYTYEVNVEPFAGKFSGLDYWRCYETKNVTIWYEKGGYDLDEKIIHGSPYIQVKTDSTTIYEYALRRSFSLDYVKTKQEDGKNL